MSIEFVLEKKEEMKDYNLITGFHGIGTTGFIAMKYMINKIEAKKIGTVISQYLPPFISTKNGKISLPFELYKKGKNIFLIPQFQPYRHEQREFAKKLVEWTIEEQFKKAILIGGLDSRLKKEEGDKIRIVVTSEYQKNNITNMPVLENGLFVTGPLALMLAFYEIKRFPAIALLPYAENSRADPKAAAIAIEKINKILGLEIDTDELIQDAEEIEKNLEEIVSQTKEQEIEDKKHGPRQLYI